MCTVSAGTGAVRGTGTFHDRCPGMGVYGTRKARLSARGGVLIGSYLGSRGSPWPPNSW